MSALASIHRVESTTKGKSHVWIVSASEGHRIAPVKCMTPVTTWNWVEDDPWFWLEMSAPKLPCFPRCEKCCGWKVPVLVSAAERSYNISPYQKGIYSPLWFFGRYQRIASGTILNSKKNHIWAIMLWMWKDGGRESMKKGMRMSLCKSHYSGYIQPFILLDIVHEERVKGLLLLLVRNHALGLLHEAIAGPVFVGLQAFLDGLPLSDCFLLAPN